MGNSGSGHQQQATLVEGPPHSWAHSFPRTTSFKVLPDRIPGQKLRLTDNGAILHNGGTISGRKPYAFEPPVQGFRNGGFQNGQDYRRTLYGSEPDLRYTRDTRDAKRNYMPQTNQTYYNNNNDNSVKARIGRSRKKYKAPPAPHNNSADSSSPDSYHRWETSADSSDVTTPSRRSRLFKTRAETKRPSFDHGAVNKYAPNSYSQMYKGQVPGQLQRSLSSPQFQDELTAKLRERAIREPPVGKAADSPHNSPVLRSKENISQAKKPVSKSHASDLRKPNGKAHNVPEKLPLKNGIKSNANNVNHSSNAYRSRPPKDANKRNDIEQRNHSKAPVQNGVSSEKFAHRKVTEKKEPEKKQEKPSAPVKKFYFGMESDAQQPEPLVNGDTNEIVDKFAETLKKSPAVVSNTSPSESFSSEPTNDDSSAGISLKLRPTLPRKQLDIPRFSPTAAWRLLSALESPVHSEEDDLMLIEEQIPHPHAGHHQLTDKSGDSGISGDASPQHQDSTHNSQVAWTPQQDLEETSSDGGLESAPVSPESIGTAKFSPRFSLSLPRDERVPPYPYSDKIPSEIFPSSSFQNLKKLKRSVSGALGRNKEVAAVSSLDENWLLSRSVPNLFHNSYANRWSDTSPSSGDQDDDPACSVGKPPSFSYLANGGHIMYLPEYKNTKQQRERKVPNLTQMSKSCEDLTRHQVEKSNHMSNMSSSPNPSNSSNSNRTKSSRKFTFQSTIRQIERKRIAEKLSKEAEEKERRRLHELEAMKKVEEEFQRKREREKADIRHQLRLYNLTEGGREQPDGAVIPPSPPGTQILSEYRQPRRDYRDYTPMRSDLDSISHSDPGIKKETVHPEVVYKMPKNAQVYVTPHHSNSGNGSYHSRVDSPKSLSTDNYRKDFAQGALPRSVASSDSELSQPNTRPTSRTKQRSRSQSPELDDEANEPEDYDISTNEIPIIDSSLNRKESLKNSQHNKESVHNKITPQPYNRNKTYKPVLFKPFSDKIAQVTS